LDPLSGYLLLAARLREYPAKYAGAWNFGPSSSEVLTVQKVAQTIIEIFGSGTLSVALGDGMQHEARLLQLNCDKAHQLLGWYPRWNAEQTLAMTADWYKSVLGGADVSKVTQEQLQVYFSNTND
jgi:CDP-glucose 4,6-dehydratase